MSKTNTAIDQDFTVWLRNAAVVRFPAYDEDRNQIDLVAEGVTTAKWVYAESDGDDPIVEKALGSGVAIVGANNDEVEVTLDVADLDPDQVAVEPGYEYYHELKLEDWTSAVGEMTTRDSSA